MNDCRPTGLSERAAVVKQRLMAVKQRIVDAGGADLLPVTKFFPVDDIRILSDCGVRCVGESRIQEAAEKYEQLCEKISFHMIGRVQTNKTNSLARWADMVHTIDSSRVVHALNKSVGLARMRGHRRDKLAVLLQWSVDANPARGGAARHVIDELADSVCASEHLVLRGLMVIPPVDCCASSVFAEGRKIVETIGDRIVGSAVYSAGMSGDFELAIAQGSTLVRVGTDILGCRSVV